MKLRAEIAAEAAAGLDLAPYRICIAAGGGLAHLIPIGRRQAMCPIRAEGFAPILNAPRTMGLAREGAYVP